MPRAPSTRLRGKASDSSGTTRMWPASGLRSIGSSGARRCRAQPSSWVPEAAAGRSCMASSPKASNGWSCSIGISTGQRPWSAISAGARPVPAELLPPDLLVLDLVYNPPTTRLLRDAEAAGDTTLNGELMLLHQGAAAFTLWTGKPAPLELMQSKLEESRAVGLEGSDAAAEAAARGSAAE